MSDRDAWILFVCACVVRSKYLIADAELEKADTFLEALRKRDKEKLFDRTEGGYRDTPKVK